MPHSKKERIGFTVAQLGRARITAALISLALLVGACSGSDDAGDSQTVPIQLLGPEAFAAFVDANPAADLINVHVPYQGHIGGTDAFVNFEEILGFAGLPEDRDDPVVLYCRSGTMSGQAAADLADAGFINIVDLAGGMNAWSADGRKLLTEEPAGTS